MGGVVIGGVKDNSSIFYNPGSLAFADTGSFSINASLYQLENTKVRNALGREKDITSASLKSFPLLFSGIIATKNPRLKLGYGIATSVDFNFTASARLDGNYPIVDDAESPGDELFIGELDIHSSIDETLFGGAIGYRLNDSWSIGATNLFLYRDHDYEKILLSRFYLNTPGNPLVNSDLIQRFSYWHLRYILRLGIVHHSPRIDLGMIVNLPSLGLGGGASVAADMTAQNIAYNGQRVDLFANDRQEKLNPVYKSSFSVAGGMNWRIGRSLVSFTTQYFIEQPIYDIIHAKPAAFVRPPDIYPDLGSDEFLRVKSAALPIWNFGVACEVYIDDHFSFNTSAILDNTYFNKEINKERGIKPDISTWDIWHITAGTNVKKGRFALSVGALLGFGKNENHEQQGNLSRPKESNFLQGELVITKANYISFGFLLGATLNFNKQKED